MTQEDKYLLLQDLCCRLPYQTQVYAQNDIDWYHSEICTQVLSDVINEDYIVKPYLFPMSSMTKEQREEFDTKTFEFLFGEVVCKKKDEMEYGKLMAFELDFYHKHHLDWRGLIAKGLARDATDLNIY